MKKVIFFLILAIGEVVELSGQTSEPLKLDIESGVRSEEIVGALSYDTLWQGVANADYRILVNGVELSSGSGAGTVPWHPAKYGTYVLTYQTFVDDEKVGEDSTATFTLAGKDLVNAEIILAENEVLYDGMPKRPKVTIVYQEETLVEGVDYELAFAGNVNPGVATMTISGKNRFSDILEKNFTIRPAGVCSLDIESGVRVARETEPLNYDDGWFGEEASTYKMYVDGKELTQGTGVGAYDWMPRAVGVHQLTYRSYSGGYLVSDEYQSRFHVAGRDLVHATITFNDKTILYDGTERKPSITIALNDKILEEGLDYSLVYSNNINPGVGIITVTGLGAYVDILDVPFTIRPAGICFLDVESGTRSVVGPVPLCYDASWNGNVDAATRMELLSEKDGAAATTISNSLTGVGEYTFSPEGDAAYVMTLNTYVNGILQMGGKIYTATFNYKAPVKPMPEAAVAITGYSGKYDGGGHGITVTVDPSVPDPTIRYALTADGPFVSQILLTNVCGTTVWCEVSAAGYIPHTNSATVAISKQEVVLNSGSKIDFVYDGQPHQYPVLIKSEDWFVAGEGITTSNWATVTAVTEGEVANTFDYAPMEGTTLANYDITVVTGKIAVTSGEIVNPFDPDDPTNPATAEDFAKANCITNYDGDGHSIEVAAFLNPLIAANNPQITYSLLRDGTYEAQKPVFTNVVSTRVWYRIEADNFNMFTTNALLKILPRSITNVNVAAIADQTYTGFGVEPIPAVTDMRTLIGMSEPTNILAVADYDRSYLNNTNVGAAKVVLTGKNNYEGALTNVFQIVPAIIPPGPTGAIVAIGYTNAYDGAAHGVSVSAAGLKTKPTVQYKSSPSAEWQGDSPTYTDVCDTQVWWKVSAPNYQSVEGTIGLKIAQAENVWTTDPAIDDWTYGETAKMPVGAAKFGEVAFTYSPATVGAAGGYTMTATVAGTVNYTGLSKTVNFTIEKATLPGGGEEPGGGSVPEGGVSKFDAVAMYDGEGHTIKTNDLVAAFKAAVGGDVVVSYACGGAGVPALPWMAVAPDFTNVCETSVWYKVASANYLDFVHEAKVTVTNRPVTLTSGTESFDYDGNAHSNMTVTVGGGGFVAGEGITSNNFATITGKGTKPNAFDYELILNPGSVAENYHVTCVTGTLTVVAVPNAWIVEPKVTGKAYDGTPAAVTMGTPEFGTVSVTYDGGQAAAPVGAGDHTAKFIVAATADYGALEKVINYTITKAAFPGGGEEPGDGSVPEGGVSKFDTVAMYDGEGWTIKTNDLVTAFKAAVGGDVVVEYAYGGAGVPALPWMTVAPDFTNVCVTSVWYKVASANYLDFVHEAKVTVTNRPVTLTSGTKLDFVYDGKPHAYTNLTVTAGSFVAGEGIATSNWATVMTVAEGQVPNTFDFGAEEGTLLSNYALTVVTGEIAVVSPDAVVVTVTGHVASVVYDGLKKSVSGYDIVSISNPLYTAADFKFTGQSSTNGTNAGTYPMGLKSSDFVNTNPNFSSVVFNVTDGRLVISQAANAWTTEPAIGGWTYGEMAKTPVGAAKFGTVSFVYSPMPVGAAGDYTLTASVAGTANYTGLSSNVTFTIAKAALPGGGEEPGGGAVPEGGVSKFDAVAMYDGEGHTIKTNELVAAFKAAVGDDVTVRYGVADGEGAVVTQWLPIAPDFTNVCVTSVWYKVTSANYQDSVHEAKVTVTNRPVTLTSGTKTDFTYDGKPHAYTNLTVTTGSFVVGEGIATSNWATVTTVAEGQVPNAFDYVALDGTKLSNYDLTVVTGKIAVVSPDAVVVTITGHVASVTYDGTKKSVSGYDVVSISDSLYTAADFKFVGQSVTNGTNAGTYPMGLKSSDFVNTNANFSSVVFNVTDGQLVIAQAANAWTTEPAIEGWTYGETAKRPVGAAKFGTVTFAYSPMPVGAAGDYTMTATVVGTANYTGLSKTVDFTIAKAALPGGGEEPGSGSVPEGGVSKFDAVAMYDGEGHTIKTNEMRIAFAPYTSGEDAASPFRFAASSDGPWGELPTVVTNVGVTSVWYKFSSANYEDYVHEARVAVTNRPVTLTSGTKTDFIYDGKPHAFTNLTVTAGSFVAGEGIATSSWATVTAVAEGVVPNSFDYAPLDGTKLSNYDLSIVTGKIAVVSPDAVFVTVTGHVSNVVYDGTKKSISGYDVVSISDPLYTVADFTFTGQSATNGTNAGTYPMGLKTSDFANTNPNFASVVFNVTDGELVISQAQNAWTTEPAIEGWTYGETAKTPVGAAKFGEVAFAYSPMPVGAAGDYTMTATVAGTANYTGLSKSVGFKISKGALPPGDDPDPLPPGVDPDDPGQREDPDVRFSAFDYVGMYDGEAHTIDTNALKQAWTAALGAVTLGYSTASNGAYQSDAFLFKDAVVTSFWYKVTSANYADIVKRCKEAITNRPVTVTSGTKLDFIYDGKPHAYTNLTVTAGSFVAGEGIATSNWATVTTVAEGQVPNAFDYVALDGTKLSNYDLTVVTGKIAVVKGPLSPGDDPDPTDPSVDPDDPGQREDPTIPFSAFDYVGMYDGAAHTIDTNALKAAWTEKLGAVTVGYSAAFNGTYQAMAFAFKDVGVTSFWYKVTSVNYADIVKPCKVVVTNRCVTLTSGTKLDFAYDGQPHAFTNLTVTAGCFVAGEGVATSNWATVTAVAEGQVPNAFDYVALDGTKLSNYDLTVITGKIAVVKGPLSPGDDPDPTDPGVDPDDPGQKEDPTIPFSVFDYMGMYDGEAHTIDTNALKAAWTEKLGAVTVGYSAASNGTYQSDAFLFKDAGVTSFWYKVTSANYADIVKPCKVAITNRPVTVTSGTKLDFTYDGKPHAFTNLTVTAGSFVAGEGIATSDWATVTMVAEGQVDNAFDFSPLEGTLLSNYDLSIVTGKIAVVSPDAVIVTVTGHVANVVYDGTKKSVSGYDVVSISDPLYMVADFTFTGQSATNGTNAGTYPMGLKTSDFANTNPNFASVVFNVTDGELVISQAQNAWTTEPAIEDWTYGETAKTPVGAAKFGEVSFAYSPMPVGAAGDYVMTATVVGTANYTGLSKTVDFKIAKAAQPGGGEEPGSGAVPEGGVSKFDAVAMYDGEGHTIKTNELVAAFKATIGNDFAVSYAVGESGGQGLSALPPTDASAWMTVAPDFTNVCETSVWYKVTSANYEDFVHEARVTVMPRDISNVTISDIPDQQHTGGAINPNVVVTDGNPSIISSADYDVGYSDNVNVGTATVTLMGKRNYSGTKMATFKIVSGTAVLQAEIAWKLLKASGTYMAQLKVTCTSGLTTGISNLRFMFADRVSGGTTYASLWDTPKRAAKSTTMPYSGDTYRYVALDASRITAENVAVTYGVRSLAATSIPTAERTIELYVRKRVNPTTGKEEAAGVDNFVGYLSWTSGGETSYLPIVAGAQAASFSKAALRAPAPMKLAAVNAALAVGSVIAEGSSPYCKLTEFTVGDNEITGVVEVGAVSSDGAEYPGKLGPNATVTLLGTNDLGRDFKVICSVTTDNAGRFRLATPKDCQFFKLKLTVEEVVE